MEKQANTRQKPIFKSTAEAASSKAECQLGLFIQSSVQVFLLKVCESILNVKCYWYKLMIYSSEKVHLYLRELISKETSILSSGIKIQLDKNYFVS